MNPGRARQPDLPHESDRDDAPRSARGPVLAESHAPPQPHKSNLRYAYAVWIGGIVALFCLHFPHLLADFPNYSPWMDYSKYTDEGWYGNAAARYYIAGHWYFHGDFNPAVALPVWPLLLAILFHFTGVSLAAARALVLAVFGCNLLLTWRLVRTQAEPWVALLAVTLLVSSPFLYAFGRLALLEPTLVCFLLLSWLLALRLPHASARSQILLLAAIGLLLCLMVLTKTTAIFVLPSTLYLIARAYDFRWVSCRALAVTASAAALPWCAWYFLFVRPHYRVDYQYLFDVNHWAEPSTVGGWIAAFWYALHGTLWISPTLGIIAALLLLLSLIPWRTRDADPATSLNPVVASLLAAGGIIFFTGWHNHPQPRYYAAVVYPLCIVLALLTADLLRRNRPLFLRAIGVLALIVMAVVSAAGTIRIAGYIRHPQYEFVTAAKGIAAYIDQHPGQHRLLLSISGDDLSLMTGVPAICDDFGTWDLPFRIHAWQPGWYAAWNDIDPGSLADLQTQYSPERVAAFPAFDDPDRNLLVLYRLVPLPPAQQTYLTEEENADNARK